jgi:hypothetical protein
MLFWDDRLSGPSKFENFPPWEKGAEVGSGKATTTLSAI